MNSERRKAERTAHRCLSLFGKVDWQRILKRLSKLLEPQSKVDGGQVARLGVSVCGESSITEQPETGLE